MRLPAAFVTASLQSLQVRAGLAGLPDRGRDWMGLGRRLPAAFVTASLQSLQVRSGLAELPDRVRNWMVLEAGISARQLMLPHREAVLESCTGASYQPEGPGTSPRRYRRPMLPVAASTECSPGSSRVVSPSLVCVTSVTRRSGDRP